MVFIQFAHIPLQIEEPEGKKLEMVLTRNDALRGWQSNLFEAIT